MRQWRDKFPGKTVVAGDDLLYCCDDSQLL